MNERRVEMWVDGRRIGIAPASKDQHYVFLCCPESDIAGRTQQPFNLEAWVIRTRNIGAISSAFRAIPPNTGGLFSM